MGLIQDDQVAVQVLAGVHGIIELVSQDFGGADDHLGIGVFFDIPGEDPHMIFSEQL